MATKKKTEIIILLLVLVVASFLRLYRIADYMTFLGDEGRDALWVKRIIVDHKLTLLGPTASVGGFFLGPLYYYMMLPFLWAFRLNPVGPAVMVALIGIATVYLVYKAGKDFFNSKVGLLAAAFYAVSPLVISYSRSSWNPNIMPFFSLLTVYLTWQVVTKKRYSWLFLVGLLFGLTFQIHYLATFLLAAIGIYLLIFVSWRRHWHSYLAAVVGFVIGWSPFLLFELRHQFPNFRSLYKFIFYGSETGYVAGKFIPIITDVIFRLFQRLVTNNQAVLTCGLILLSFWFFISGWLKSKSKKIPFQTYSLLGVWLLVGVLLFGFYQKPIYDYYFGFMFPLPFLLAAFSLTNLAKINKLFRYIAILLSCYLVFVNLRGIPFQYQPNKQLKQTQDIAHLVLEKTGNNPFNFALITGQNSDHGYRYFLELWGAKPVTIENSQIDSERKTVTNQLLVVCEVVDCQPLGNSLWEIAGFGRAEIVGSWPAPGGIQVFKLIHYQGNE